MVMPALVADMNISVKVVEFLRSRDVDIISAFEEEWHLYEDADILAYAFRLGRFVLTHDSDFGHLAYYHNHPVIGIIYLRPGGRKPDDVISDLHVLLDMSVDWTPPLIAVYKFGRLRIRRI